MTCLITPEPQSITYWLEAAVEALRPFSAILKSKNIWVTEAKRNHVSMKEEAFGMSGINNYF